MALKNVLVHLIRASKRRAPSPRKIACGKDWRLAHGFVRGNTCSTSSRHFYCLAKPGVHRRCRGRSRQVRFGDGGYVGTFAFYRRQLR